MKTIQKKKLSFILTVVCIFNLIVPVKAVSNTNLDSITTDAGQYIYETVTDPTVSSIGGEWAIIGLARSNYAASKSYYQKYYNNVENYVKKSNGILHDKKYTEYSRVILGLTALGKDARNIAGYDLTLPLGDYEKTIWQGLNGPIWALIALDSRDYPMPQNSTATVYATRQMYVDYILAHQLTDGGWNLSGEDSQSDPDMTGMALQALSKYQTQTKVSQAIQKALACMSQQQNEQGGFSSWNTENSESDAQMLVALCELGISLNDTRFVKNGHSILDNLLTYYQKGHGFLHTKDNSETNLMASEQGLYALAAVQRAENGKNSLYSMRDAESFISNDSGNLPGGLSGKHADVKALPITKENADFPDISGHSSSQAIKALASRQIINGKSNGLFEPEANMTRAEFASIVVKALGLPAKITNQFSDVASGSWYAPYVGSAYTYGIVSGTSATTFNPLGTITRQEATVMVCRAAKLCGMNTLISETEIKDTLAQFTDYKQVANWAQVSVAFCYREQILDTADLNIQPKVAIRRGEIAEMLYRMLGCAKLL
jgi:prenyltransferase beta subunit